MGFSLPSIKFLAAAPTAEHCFVIWILLKNLITARSTIVGSWEESPNTWLTVAKNTYVGRALNVRVRMLLKSAVNVVQPQAVYICTRSVLFHARDQLIFMHVDTHVEKRDNFYYYSVEGTRRYEKQNK